MHHKIKIILAFSLMALFGCKEKAPEPVCTFHPGMVWKDTDGKPIEAHGGGIIRKDDTYYWYGTNHELGHGNKLGVSGYASKDLCHWENMGVVFPKDSLPKMFRDSGVCERPKVIYNDSTKKYVMWMHLDANHYQEAKAGVAIADKPEGPFSLVKIFRPVKTGFEKKNVKTIWKKYLVQNTFRDMNLFKDDNGEAYVFYASEGNKTMYVVQLNSDYTDIKRPVEEGRTWQRMLIFKEREAPAPFKYNGKYYMITSGCTGWAPNGAQLHVADSIFGKWETLGNPCAGKAGTTTFNSQSTFVLPVNDICDGCFIFMADRWNPGDLSKSTYVWLPFYMRKETDSITINYYDQWDLSIFNIEGKPEKPVLSVAEKEEDKVLAWKKTNNTTGYHIIRNNKFFDFITDYTYEIPPQLVGRDDVFRVMATNLFESSSPSAPVVLGHDKPEDIYLGDIEPDFWSQSFGRPHKNKTIHGRKLNINGQIFNKGIWTHATSEIIYYISGGYDRFSAWVGCDYFTAFNDYASVSFRVIGDGMMLYHSGIMTVDSAPEKVDVSVKGINELKLVVTDGGDGTHYDHANWAEAKLIVNP